MTGLPSRRDSLVFASGALVSLVALIGGLSWTAEMAIRKQQQEGCQRTI